MWYFTQIYRMTNFLPGICKNINRTKWLHPVQTQACNNYTKKCAEEKLGIDKPKRPLNPFFKFMSQMRPALLTKIPGISTKDAIVWSSQHWQQLDSETKAKMAEEYKRDLEDYKEKKAKYQASLTDQQKTDIKSMNDKIIASKNRRKLKSEWKEFGKPKKPMSSYILYIQSRNGVFPHRQVKEYQEKIKTDWLNLPDSEKAKFDAQAKELMTKYHKDMEAWELKMISLGHIHLVRKNPKKKKTALSQ